MFMYFISKPLIARIDIFYYLMTFSDHKDQHCLVCIGDGDQVSIHVTNHFSGTFYEPHTHTHTHTQMHIVV